MSMSSEEVVLQWARDNKISEGAVERLFEEGFTSLEAISFFGRGGSLKSLKHRGTRKAHSGLCMWSLREERPTPAVPGEPGGPNKLD